MVYDYIGRGKMLNTLKKFFFSGKLIDDNEEEWPALVYLEYDEYDPSVMSCTATLEIHSASFGDSRGLESNPRIVGELPNGSLILIKSVGYSNLSWFQSSRIEVKLNVDVVLLGPSGDVRFNAGEFSYLITLLDAPSVRVRAGTESSYLGSIKRGRKEDDAISWESDIGTVRIANYYELGQGQVGVEKAAIQVEKTQLGIFGNFVSKINVEESFSRVEEGIKKILTILSFINRKFVHWYRIEANYIDAAEPRNYARSEKRRRISLYKGKGRDPLFSQAELKKGLLFDLIEAYVKSSVSKTIERSIMYLAGSYELDRLEAQLLVAYSALEAIVNQISKREKIDKCLCNRHFDKLIEKYRNELQTFCEKEVGDKQVIYLEDIKEKLSEIKIRPLRNRIFDLIQSYNIDCSDIWDLSKIDPKYAIQEIIKRRNKLIHDPENVNPDFLYPDLVRVRALCERIILAELAFNDYKRFYPLAYNQLHSFRELL